MVVVVYNPDNEDFITNIRYYVSAAEKVVVIDNSKKPILKDKLIKFKNVEYIQLFKNVGIAKAQNIGIKRLLEIKNIKYILFFDQDSYLSENSIFELYSDLKFLEKNKNIGLIAPKENNTVSKERYSNLTEVISSGSLIPVKSLKVNGLMMEELFIDFVDYEWCWRASKNDYLIICDNKVCLNHQTGKKNSILGKIISQPFRDYYLYRNIIFLSNQGLTIWSNKKILFKLFKRTIFELVFCGNKRSRFSYIVRGIKSGIHKDMGSME